MFEATPEEYGEAKRIYAGNPHFYPLVAAVLEQTQTGNVLKDDSMPAKAWLVIHHSGYAQIFGDITPQFALAAQNYLLAERNFAYPKVRLYTPWLPPHAPEYPQWRSERRRFKLDAGLFERQCGQLDAKNCVPITPDNVDEIEEAFGIAARFWRCKADFASNALAWAGYADGRPASLCYAAAVANGKAEIDVLTLPSARCQGLGLQTAAAFIRASLARGIEPLWDCFTNNQPSLSLARRLGFVPAGEPYQFYTIPAREQTAENLESEYNLGLAWQRLLAAHGPKTALLHGPNEQTSFEKLGAWANALAGFLLANACRKGDVIAIAHEKTPLAYAAMLACLKLGMPYVILDSASPAERLARIIATAQPRLIFYDSEKFEANLEPLGPPLTFLTHDFAAKLPPCDCMEQTRAVDGETIAYIMYTSGSTGNPKGVAVPHGNVLRFIAWGRQRFHFGPGHILAQLSPMYFDNSVLDFYGGLFNGATLAPIGRDLLQSPYELVRHLADCSCNFWFSVPSLLIYLMTMKALSKKLLPRIRQFAFGGEGYPKTELKKLFDLFAGQTAANPADKTILTNVYGPTECTCICSAHDLSEADFENLDGLPTLGRLNPDFDFTIKDPDEKGIGELVLMGPQVAAGYFNDPERTEAAFGACQEPNRYKKRFYRTGDLVSVQNGLLYFHGRKDNQIKHLGYRIELEEIEHALTRLEGVSRAAVLYQRQNTAFGKIIAFAASNTKKDSQLMLRELAGHLPSYMIPSRLVIMRELPKNANGKVDKKALMALCAKA